MNEVVNQAYNHLADNKNTLIAKAYDEKALEVAPDEKHFETPLPKEQEAIPDIFGRNPENVEVIDAREFIKHPSSITIKSNGTAEGTTITTTDGRNLGLVTNITLCIDAESDVVEAKLTFFLPTVDIVVPKENIKIEVINTENYSLPSPLDVMDVIDNLSISGN